MNSAAILTRLYKSERFMKSVVEQIRAIENSVVWRVLVCEGDEGTKAALMEEMKDGFPSNVAVIVSVVPKVNAQEAICRLMEQAEEDSLFIFDDDNWFLPNRVSLQRKVCDIGMGISAVRTIGIKNGKVWKYYPMNTDGMDVIIDAGAMRFKRKYAQERLVPATRRAMARTEGGPGLYEDRFWTALAIADAELCIHPYPLHMYGFRDDSQMAAMGWEAQKELFHYTSLKILEEVGSKLTAAQRQQVERAELMRSQE